MASSNQPKAKMTASAKLAASLLIIPLAAFIALYLDTSNTLGLASIIDIKSKFSQQPSIGPTIRDASSDITYIGKLGEGVEQFLGIPYAQDTSGINRFAPPKPLLSKPGSIVTATKPGPWCPQGTGDVLPFTSRIDDISEDCLSLGITRPQGTKADAKLPVLVWIHGGGHALGSYADQLYAPEGLVQQSVADGTPIIFVGINYRLGIFGFARSQALVDAGHTNMGLKDQRAAFEWVQKNIHIFGGDPNNIISIGQSVGASDTGLHMTSYGGKQGVPFNKAVMMSGAPGLTFNIQSDQVDESTAAVASAVGCVAHGESAQSLRSLECMQKVPMEQLNNISVTAMRGARPPFGEAYFYPVQDGEYIPERPSELLRKGSFVKNIPVMASWVTNDGAWYVPPPTTTDEEVTGSFTLWLNNLSKETLERLLELYPISEFEQIASASSYIGGMSPQYYRAAQMNRDIWFTCPVLDFTYHHALYNRDSSTPTYVYEHNATRFHPIFQKIMNVPFWGVSHLSDIPYMLNNDVRAGGDNSPVAKDLALKMSRSLVKFAYEGNPEAEWPVAFDLERNDEFKLMLWRNEGDDSHGGVVTVRRDGAGILDSERERERAEAVQWETLFERCDFINSPQVREEIGV